MGKAGSEELNFLYEKSFFIMERKSVLLFPLAEKIQEMEIQGGKVDVKWKRKVKRQLLLP